MGAQRNHEIELARIVQDLHHHAEQLGQRQRAGMVGDQRQHFLVGKSSSQSLGEGFIDQRRDPASRLARYFWA